LAIAHRSLAGLLLGLSLRSSGLAVMTPTLMRGEHPAALSLIIRLWHDHEEFAFEFAFVLLG